MSVTTGLGEIYAQSLDTNSGIFIKKPTTNHCTTEGQCVQSDTSSSKLSAAAQSLGCHTPFLMGVKQGKEKCMCKEGYVPVNSVFPRASCTWLLYASPLSPSPSSYWKVFIDLQDKKAPRLQEWSWEKDVKRASSHVLPFWAQDSDSSLQVTRRWGQEKEQKKKKRITKKLDEPVILNTFGLPAWQGEQPYIMSWGLLLVLMWPWVSK